MNDVKKQDYYHELWDQMVAREKEGKSDPPLWHGIITFKNSKE